MRRRTLVIATVCVATVGAAFWLGFYRPLKRNQEFNRVVRAELLTLAQKPRPEGLTAKQWHNIVGWTIQGYWNTLPWQNQPPLAWRGIPSAEMDRFEAELKHRLADPVDLATIDWIWDEFERLAPDYGPKYSRNHRPTSPEKLREFEEGNTTWSGLETQ